MRIPLISLALLASAVPSFGAGDPDRREEPSICLTANNLSIATGQPSLVLMSSGPVQIPVWSLSGFTAGQSVAGLVTGEVGEVGEVGVRQPIVTGCQKRLPDPDFPDLNPDPTTGLSYKDVSWHSGEFLFTNMSQSGFWSALLDSFGVTR